MIRAIFFLIFFSASRGYCIFEDNFADARALGLANSISASGFSGAYKLNPAMAGETRDHSLTPSCLFGHSTQQGDKKFKSLSLDFLRPSRVKTKNLTWSFGYSRSYGDAFDERTFSIGAGTWHLFEEGDKVLDAGANLKALNLSSNEISLGQNALALDLGVVMRTKGYAFGFSILNLNSPAFEERITDDNAPRTMKLGVARSVEDYTLSADFTRRSSVRYGKSYSINSGVEYSWKTYRYGTLDTLFGLSLGDNESMVSAGFGYRNMAAEIVYSMAFPISGPAAMINGISLILRFGETNSENEYEKIFRKEMQYRKDLMGALDGSEKREKKLKKELIAIREELERLKESLKNEKTKRVEVENAKTRVDFILERQRKAQEELRLAEEKRKLDRIRQLETGFASDWENYLRMKASGAGAEALAGFLQRIINQYQGQGIDISQAAMEMQNLVK